ncbi:hypothetical protein [Leptolyngbya sp. CCY15150]|uniref:hypothetical protein n=1 Tax=Leptolyngbya sp. CCY15150 TaxID=2767772 RepID=UPI00194DAF47|nr:hypothetical protein [Leptolyngbya sp. CCY15150]
MPGKRDVQTFSINKPRGTHPQASKRDWIAVEFMKQMLNDKDVTLEDCAQAAVMGADLLLQALENTANPQQPAEELSDE